MKTIGNILWFIFSGLAMFIGWAFLGLCWCITIIGIPFGLQCFKFAKLSVFPFGHNADSDFSSHPIANVIWLVFGGLELVVAFGIVGILWCITILGIPFGKQCFKLAKLALFPFGATIN